MTAGSDSPWGWYAPGEFVHEIHMLTQAGVTVLYEHRVSAVRREGTTIRSLTLDHAPCDRFGCPVAQPAMASTRVAKIAVIRMFGFIDVPQPP